MFRQRPYQGFSALPQQPFADHPGSGDWGCVQLGKGIGVPRMRRFLTILCMILAGVLGFAGTAAADPSNSGVDSPRLVDGFGVLTDDWGDHFSDLGNSLCNGCADSFNTDTVMMWQAILASEGFLPVSEIDGQFGPITANATRQWQTRYQIGVDGQVGNETWTRADEWLRQVLVGGRIHVRYDAVGSGYVTFFRGNENAGALDGGAYQLVDVLGPGGTYGWFAGGLRIQHFSKTVTGPF